MIGLCFKVGRYVFKSELTVMDHALRIVDSEYIVILPIALWAHNIKMGDIS